MELRMKLNVFRPSRDFNTGLAANRTSIVKPLISASADARCARSAAILPGIPGELAMRAPVTIAFLVLPGCGSLSVLPSDEQAAVICAQRSLVAAKGVTKVEVLAGLYGSRPIIRYEYVDLNGQVNQSQLRVSGWAPPGKPISYFYELLDNNYMRSGSNAEDVRDLMTRCDLGMIVVTD
jgi:hypothetical protein